MKIPQDASRLWQFFYLLVTLIKPFFCRLRVEGAEHVPPTGGCIVACNHTLGPDYVVLGYATPRQVYYMAKIEIFAWHPLLTKLFEAVGTFPVHRGKGDVTAIQSAVDVVRAGHVLGMFPEGTRSRTGKLNRGKSGVARIAMMAQAPVVPAVVINSAQILPSLFKLRRRPEVIVRFGPPITVTGNPDDPNEARCNTDCIMFALAALLPPDLRGVYRET
ncbi:MAG: 1-acyl-sn-glycerol-3-phosphate acyltransferase [Chloroflexi bacterium]|nr:MAG: 1-acyl-sn-glycerol-3-phosphate acyltransferase [Chloroflexota bacterium]